MDIRKPSKSRMAQRTSTVANPAQSSSVHKMFADSSKGHQPKFWQRCQQALLKASLTRRRQWRDSWQRLRSRPISNGLLILMIGAVLFLPLSFYLVFQNILSLHQGLNNRPTASLFLHADTSAAQANALTKELRQRLGVIDSLLIQKDQGLKELQRTAGFSEEWLQSLDNNPLPDVIELTLDTDLITDLEQFRQQLAALPEADQVTLDVLWLQRLGWLVILLQRIAGLLSLALALIVVLTIANTLRLTLENARTELQVGWMVGASQSFLCRPFLYMGALYGLLGSIAALLLVGITAWWLSAPVHDLMSSYNVQTSTGITIQIILAVMVISAGLGWIGARLAVRGILAKMLPD